MEREIAHEYLCNVYEFDKDLVEEYIKEGEHQEGRYAFWEYFDNIAQLSQDFELYRRQVLSGLHD